MEYGGRPFRFIGYILVSVTYLFHVLPDDVKKKATELAAATHLELAKYQQREGTFSNEAVIANAKVMAPAAWWATYGKHVPKLQAVARRVLPGSGSERESRGAQLVCIWTDHDARA